MKKVLRQTLGILIVQIFICLSNSSYSQGPPPPPGGASGTGAGGGGSNEANGAPIGGGLFILLGLAAAYGGKKVYDIRKEKLEE